MKNKKGFELIWSTWVIMILAIMLLLFLILLFTGAASGFVDYVKGFYIKTNVDSVVRGCNFLTDSGSRYDFCCQNKTVKYFKDEKLFEEEYSCYQLINQNFTNGEVKNIIKCSEVTCQ